MTDLLRVEGLRVAFGERDVVRGVDLRVGAGECLAIVGESGSGKSVTARALLGLTGGRVDADALALNGRSLLGLSERKWREIRGREIGLISQDALVSLDPFRPIGREIGDALRLHTRMSASARRGRVLETLAEVGLPDPALRFGQRSGDLSGGQRQRALIASAVVSRPPLIVADEPTTALDVTVQAQILDLLRSLTREGAGLVLISHDLAVVSAIADRIAVMSDGVIVEEGPTSRVLTSPVAEQTRALIAAVPFGRPRGSRLSAGGPAASAGPLTAPASSPTPALRATGLTKTFRLPGRDPLTAVADVSFELPAGTTLGLVGESGSGKSTTARLVLALTTPDAGEVQVEGRPWSALGESARGPHRRLMGAIYQDPLSSFDPRLSVRDILGDAIPRDIADGRTARLAEARRLLGTVGLDDGLLDRRPLHLSGGQRQRVSIARALAPRPRILICDEPVSALDVSVQATVLDLLDELQRELGLSYLFISHDLGVIQHVSDTVAVMEAGRIVETGPTEQLFREPRHPYTRRLLDSAPRLPV
ncbi:dipeptide ABC transporter ATP-binding protein [Amnibacterium flavum]|uniref:ABC transporter ATP-binding protein n=1 Tax=Amnibacterium flavum TaxID=2173173 RepID=A0A2V1HNW5_9MICO|nr:ABC transporter ATP-binding protein [Amnibacterium flavum]PVZ94021.1 ABC transporter ATP-binding protein [Amnibacterium flavum]